MMDTAKAIEIAKKVIWDAARIDAAYARISVTADNGRGIKTLLVDLSTRKFEVTIDVPLNRVKLVEVYRHRKFVMNKKTCSFDWAQTESRRNIRTLSLSPYIPPK